MKIQSVVKVAMCSAALWIALAAGIHAAESAVPGWDPDAFRTESTLQIMTTGPDEGEHWGKLWLVVIDGKLYVRLGDRSYERIQKNTTSPYLKVKVAGKEFDKVRLDETPDMKDKVAAAMADKYFMDILIRHESHPMTARLTAEPAPAPSPH
jgi:glucose/arabinose dehydrogenase